MAFEIGLTVISVPASGDLSTKQYMFGTINGAGQVAVATDAAAADGVICNKPSAAGQPVALATNVGQVVKVKAGGAIAAGASVEASSGKAVTLNAGKILGKALAAAGADGDIIPVLLILQR